MAIPPGLPPKKEGLRCECGKLLLEKDPEMGLGVRCGRRECDKFHPLEEINRMAAEFEKEKKEEKMVEEKQLNKLLELLDRELKSFVEKECNTEQDRIVYHIEVVGIKILELDVVAAIRPSTVAIIGHHNPSTLQNLCEKHVGALIGAKVKINFKKHE